MTTYADQIQSLVATAHAAAVKAERLSVLASKIDLAVALNDVPKRDQIQSITLGNDQMSKMGGSACLLTVTGTDGTTYRDFDELYELVDEHVFQNGSGVPADLVGDQTETFNVQSLIASIPALARELEDTRDALTVILAE